MNPSFIMCIIPSNRGDTYSSIKKLLCVSRAGNYSAINLMLYIVDFSINVNNKNIFNIRI